MSSPISSALAKLDDCLQSVQVQVDYLRAGLDVDDDQLSYVLADACQNAAEVRDMIRAERSDATWNGREALENLIVELEIAAHEKLNEQRRTRLLDLSDELDAGSVKHRSEARATALNHVRQDAVQQLRADAAIPEQQKELPGPEASEWVHWVCNLQEDNDADALLCLRTDFPALDQFAGEMEESYWVPGDRVRRNSLQAAPAAPRRIPEPSSYSPSRPPSSGGGEYGRTSHNVAPRPETPTQGGNYATAVARAYDRPSTTTPVSAESRRTEPSGGIALVTEPPQTSPAPPVQEPVRVPVAPAQRTAARTTYPVADKPKNGGNGAAPISESRTSVTAPLKPSATVVVTPVEKPKPQPQPAAKQPEKKAKDRKQQQQQQQQQQAQQRQRPAAEAAPAVAAAAAADVARVKTVAQPQKPSVEKKTWAQKWQDVQAEGFQEGRGRALLFAPETLVVIAVLLCAVIGLSTWLMRRKPVSPAPAAAQNTTPVQTSASPLQAANAQAPATTTANPATTNVKNPPDTQTKAQDQSAKPADTTQQKEPTTNAQVLSPAPEVPKPNRVAKNEEPSANEPPPMPGALPGAAGGMGNIVKDMQVAVPKLAGQKLRVSSGVAQAQLTHQVTPQYPSEARQERVQGTVILQAVIGKDGSVQKLNIISGPSQLTKAAMQAVKQWRYKPFSLNGEAVEADTQINVNFKLGE